MSKKEEKKKKEKKKKMVYQGIVCYRCKGRNVRLAGNMFINIPSKWEGNLTSLRRRSKNFEVWGVGWDTMSEVCRDCGYTRDRKKGKK